MSKRYLNLHSVAGGDVGDGPASFLLDVLVGTTKDSEQSRQNRAVDHHLRWRRRRRRRRTRGSGEGGGRGGGGGKWEGKGRRRRERKRERKGGSDGGEY